MTAMAGGWTFTPEKGDATSDVERIPDYLAYGFWLKRTRTAMAETTYNEVETYAMAVGHPATAMTGLGMVTGTATYEGGSAIGVYVKNVTRRPGALSLRPPPATSRRTSSMNANFGGGNVPQTSSSASMEPSATSS